MENERITIDNTIFTDDETAINFLISAGVLKSSLICEECSGEMILRKNNVKCNGKEFKCVNRTCKQRRNVYLGLRDEFPRIKLTKILQCLYYYVLELSNYQVTILTGVSEKSYISLKKIFLNRIYSSETQQRTLIGGEGIVFQVDETAVCRRGLVRNPTTTELISRDTVWLLGMIQENNPTNLILEVLPDRTVSTLHDFFTRNLLPNSIIKSDGYPSYPRAIESSGCVHLVVNHSVGFINEQGEHTNLIENVWSHLKTELRTRRGVMLSNMENFAREFVIFRKFNSIRSQENTSIFFKTMIRSLSFN